MKATELPRTWSAWRAGRITEWKAMLIARETACLTREDRPVPPGSSGGRHGQKEAYRLDPASYVARRRQAEADRRVSLRPAPDAMTWLSALLPVKDGVAVKVALTRAADSARAAGDPRSQGPRSRPTPSVDSVLAGAAPRESARSTSAW